MTCGDCTCCAAVASVGQSAVVDDELAEGLPDGQVATLGENSGLTLQLGREVVDLFGADFELVGTVLSESTPTSDLCSIGASSTGAVEVHVVDEQGRLRQIGVWSQNQQEFDLGCAEISRVQEIRLQGQPGTLAELDAVSAQSCCETNGTCTTPGGPVVSLPETTQ